MNQEILGGTALAVATAASYPDVPGYPKVVNWHMILPYLAELPDSVEVPWNGPSPNGRPTYTIHLRYDCICSEDGFPWSLYYAATELVKPEGEAIRLDQDDMYQEGTEGDDTVIAWVCRATFMGQRALMFNFGDCSGDSGVTYYVLPH